MRFQRGQTIVRRIMHWDGRIAAVTAAIVVGDDEDGLRLWLDQGSATLRRVTLAGEPTRHIPIRQELTSATTMQPHIWPTYRTLMVYHDGAHHSVWCSWLGDEFSGWYVNLERPFQRWPGGIDVLDQQLDLLVWADGRLEWKDEDEFEAQTDDPLYWTSAEATVIRAEGERMADLARAKEAPFDGRWRDFQPDPAWAPAQMPYWWDVPAERAHIWLDER